MTAGDRRTDFTMACTVKVLDHVIFFTTLKLFLSTPSFVHQLNNRYVVRQHWTILSLTASLSFLSKIKCGTT